MTLNIFNTYICYQRDWLCGNSARGKQLAFPIEEVPSTTAGMPQMSRLTVLNMEQRMEFAACDMQTAPERGAASAEGLSTSRMRPLADSDPRPLEQLCKQDAAFELHSSLSFGALISTLAECLVCATTTLN